jgi:hypothetical protein
VDHHGPIAGRGPGLTGALDDVGVERDAVRRFVAVVGGVDQHVDRHAVVVVAGPASGELGRVPLG